MMRFVQSLITINYNTFSCCRNVNRPMSDAFFQDLHKGHLKFYSRLSVLILINLKWEILVNWITTVTIAYSS